MGYWSSAKASQRLAPAIVVLMAWVPGLGAAGEVGSAQTLMPPGIAQ